MGTAFGQPFSPLGLGCGYDVLHDDVSCRAVPTWPPRLHVPVRPTATSGVGLLERTASLHSPSPRTGPRAVLSGHSPTGRPRKAQLRLTRAPPRLALLSALSAARQLQQPILMSGLSLAAAAAVLFTAAATAAATAAQSFVQPQRTSEGASNEADELFPQRTSALSSGTIFNLA